jgi:hypothetical protein
MTSGWAKSYFSCQRLKHRSVTNARIIKLAYTDRLLSFENDQDHLNMHVRLILLFTDPTYTADLIQLIIRIFEQGI